MDGLMDGSIDRSIDRVDRSSFLPRLVFHASTRPTNIELYNKLSLILHVQTVI